MPDQRLAIAQVSPFAWESKTEIGDYVRLLSRELHGRGHRVLIIAPSNSAELVHRSRKLLRTGPAGAQALLARADQEPLVLGVGEVLPFSPARRRAASLPVDVSRTIEEALTTLPLDLVHVHEPFAPSASSAALRNARALSVGTFHNPTERLLSTQFGRQLSQLLFSRLDARLASYEATRVLMDRYFPADYSVVLPGAEPVRPLQRSSGPAGREDRDHLHLCFVAEEERAALRTALRALRLLPAGARWRATVWSSRPLAAPAALGGRLLERVRFVDAETMPVQEALAGADVLVLGSDGVMPTPGLLVAALASGIVPVATSIPVYAELLADGAHGLQYAPGDAQTLAANLGQLLEDGQRLADLRDQAEPLRAQLNFARVADDLERIYGRLAARRHDRRPHNAKAARIVADRPLIDVDLHMHTDHSYDCATPVEVLLAQARAKGLGAIAVTEHNEISGALDASEKAKGIKVIVGEEVKTASQGEVIGLFIKEKIPRGMTLQETIAEIKRQGGLVYVPHPFDRMHSVPDYKHLLDVLDDIDLIEVFNPRVAISEFNEEAVRFAAKYRMIAGAGSDAHVPQGLGSVRIRMHDFDGPEQFLESLRTADIIRNPASLLYVQALKFLQTKARSPGRREAVRERRVRRAARKS
ncbi:MAG TPA: PHP domain-containing protein [Solirubrobacteraceae bacterium]|nr:PHP domain-containing protein [Solirubrobacteraceae bacterium]